MILLILFAFFAGIVTILSPCILPVLPIVLSGSIGGKLRPYGIVTGFIASFVFFTLFLSTLVSFSGISANALRSLSIVTLITFGLSLLIPAFNKKLEILFSKVSNRTPKSNSQSGFLGGLLIGLSLGLLWTPCVGPILASVISLSLTGTVTGTSILITAAYAIGTAIPMFLILIGGRSLLNKFPGLLKNTGKLQKIFGILMVLTGIAIYLNIDRRFQSYILTTFPEYGTGLTKFEQNPLIEKALLQITRQKPDKEKLGKPMNNFVEEGLGNAPEFIPGGEWINSKPLTIKELKGKVVLVDFWTYTCINCIRTLPYIKTWNEKYKDKGLVIVGVHTPEFEFEKDLGNVKKAVKDFGLTYPIVQDNNYDTWNAYQNHYWPAKYFIDKNGKIRKTHFGEGEYDESEKIIQELLSENGPKVDEPVANPTYTIQAQSPETYLGLDRLQYLASNQIPVLNKTILFTSPTEIPLNSFVYRGDWMLGHEYAQPKPTSRTSVYLTIHFKAKKVFLVARPLNTSKVAFYPSLKSKNSVVSPWAGEDVVSSEGPSAVYVNENRLYNIVNLDQAGEYELTLEFTSPDIELYAFTFG